MISFNLISQGILTPGVFVEFDTSKAQQGPSIQPHTVLLVGQRLSTGTKAAGTIDRITSASQARQFYGAGSMLAAMCEKFLAANKLNAMSAIALDDLVGGTLAAGSIDLGGASIKAGTLGYVIAGRRYRVGVAEGDTPTAIVAALVAAIQADDDRQVTAAVNGVDATIADITYRHKGLVGNEIDIRRDPDSELPENLTSVITAMTAGTGNPDVTSVITALGEIQFNEIAIPYNDATTLGLFQTEMVDRWGPMRQNDGQLILGKRASLATLSTFADGRNNEHETVIDVLGPNGPHEFAANLAAVVAREAQTDPARPIQGVVLAAILSPLDSELRTQGEANQLLTDGISTVKALAGSVYIERLRTTRKTNNFAAPDLSLADIEPKLTLSYLRYDFRTRFTLKFSRHKLANDGTRFGPGQAVITPKIAKAELISIFRGWEELGLVEGASQFKNDLIVERNASDPNRLDIQLPPDLINQLRVTAAQIAFLL